MTVTAGLTDLVTELGLCVMTDDHGAVAIHAVSPFEGHNALQWFYDRSKDYRYRGFTSPVPGIVAIDFEERSSGRRINVVYRALRPEQLPRLEITYSNWRLPETPLFPYDQTSETLSYATSLRGTGREVRPTFEPLIEGGH